LSFGSGHLWWLSRIRVKEIKPSSPTYSPRVQKRNHTF
jgi:hypothetical protein